MIKTSALRQVCRHALRTQAQRNASTITAIKGREVRSRLRDPIADRRFCRHLERSVCRRRSRGTPRRGSGLSGGVAGDAGH
jgi:hypothetical protein